MGSSRSVKESATAYVGTFTRDEGWVNGQAKGVYQLDINTADGKITGQKLVATITNPTFLAETADKKHLYVASHLSGNKEPTGYLHVLDVAGGYREINRVATGGKSTCHVAIDATGNFVMTANYSGGVSQLYRKQADGSLKLADVFKVSDELVPGKKPHFHSAMFSPSNRIVALADLGLDRVWLFTLDQVNGKLIPHDQPFIKLADGAGPRHTTWSADGRFLYVINELNSTVSVLDYAAAEDRFTIGQTINTLPAKFKEKNSCAHVELHPSGDFLYGSNRGHNSIVIYRVDKKTGRLTLLGHQPTEGDFPRGFAVAPTGEYLYAANQNTGDISAHFINQKSGELTFTGQLYDLPTPVFVGF